METKKEIQQSKNIPPPILCGHSHPGYKKRVRTEIMEEKVSVPFFSEEEEGNKNEIQLPNWINCL
jgi:hypothetical protein